MKEYKIINFNIDSRDVLEREINRKAKEGYRLVATPIDSGYGLLIFEKNI